MKAIVDAFGGDNAPLCVLKGCAWALAEDTSLEVICTGDEKIIRQVAAENSISLARVEIVNAPDVISFDDPPTDVVRKHSGCSMAVGLRLLADGAGDLFISAGSTGALVVGGALIVGRTPGLKRPAISTILPSKSGKFMLIDSGANSECEPQNLVQFAHLGSGYMAKACSLSRPRVGLLNIGEEPIKGTGLQKEVFGLLRGQEEINFVGNVEPQAALQGVCDVLVADGFSGNIFLKSAEGASRFLFSELKGVLRSSFVAKAGALLMKKKLLALKGRMDPSYFGGAPLLGLLKPVIKAHGNSDADAIKNAILQGTKLFG